MANAGGSINRRVDDDGVTLGTGCCVGEASVGACDLKLAEFGIGAQRLVEGQGNGLVFYGGTDDFGHQLHLFIFIDRTVEAETDTLGDLTLA